MELRTFRQYPPWAEEPESVWGNNRRIQLRTETGVTPLSNSLKTASPYVNTATSKVSPEFSSVAEERNMTFAEKVNFKLPLIARQFLAEFLGTFLLVLFGDGAIAQKIGMGGNEFTPIALGYGLALMIGILATGGISGAHLNPAVTLSMAILKKCKWIQVPVYMIAQYVGAFTASAVLYGNYYKFMGGDNFANGSASGIFTSYPNKDITNTWILAYDQALGTALLVIIILAVTDEKNMKVPTGMVPLYIGLGLSAIHFSFALNAGCAVNPARDFSPRLFSLMAFTNSKSYTFGEANDYFFWIPWIMPHIGGPIGGLVYTFFIEALHPNE